MAKKRRKTTIRRRKKGFLDKVREKKAPAIPSPVKTKILGTVWIILAIFVLLSFFNQSGIAGRWLMSGITYLFGNGIYVLPLIFIIAGVAYFTKKEKQNWWINIGIVSFMLGVCGIFSVIDLNSSPEVGYLIFYSGKGGMIGNLIGWPLFKLMNFWMSNVFFGGVIAASGYIFWHYLYSPKPKEEKEEIVDEVKKEKPLIKKVFTPKFEVKKLEVKESVKKEKKVEEKIEEKQMGPGLPAETTWKLPPITLLENDKGKAQGGDTKSNAEIIEKTLDNFGIPVQMSDIHVGPTVTQYTLKPAAGVKLSKITTLNNNLALALAAHPIRIEAPIPGKSLIGIEVPNEKRAIISMKGIFAEPEYQGSSAPLLLSVGRDVMGKAFYTDLARMPHMLVAGATGSGKTIALSSMILSLLYRNSPERLRFILVDPKRVEFTVYQEIPHLLGPVIHDVQKTLTALKWSVDEMERRFDILAGVGVRNIAEYNEKISSDKDKKPMPYIVFIIDELADLMASKGKEIEGGIVKIAQKARAVGIHLVLATQRPSVEVITGLIKANVTARLAFQVVSMVDSRTILDTSGAEKLLGAGDSLFISAEYSKPKRAQGGYVSSKEIEKTVDYIIKNNKTDENDELDMSIKSELERIDQVGTTATGAMAELDPVYQEAKIIVLETKKASASFLQRKLRIGYARAARILDMLEERGIVGPADGAKAREVFYDTEKIMEQGYELGVDEEPEEEGDEELM
jgi:DNA segregation ATPase FtsK/SpoIIIE, S-DNA-T family